MKEEAPESKKRSGIWRPLVFAGVLIGAVIVARVFGVAQHLTSLQSWIQDLGPFGPVAFIFIYAAAVVAALPGSALTIVAGALFGSVLGVAIVSVAATLGASLAFLIARYVARDPISRWLSEKETFRRLDEMTERHGATIVALTRLVPLFPFNLLNYGFGLTRVRFWTYVFWSWLCMLPGAILYVVGADAVTQAIAAGEMPWKLVAVAFLAAGVLALLVVTAKRRLQKTSELNSEKGE